MMEKNNLPKIILKKQTEDKLEQVEDKPKNFFCPNCHIGFTRKTNLYRHQRQTCLSMKIENPQTDPLSNTLHEIKQELTELKEIKQRLTNLEKNTGNYAKEITVLKDKPSITNNNLHVVCIGQNDNFLDMLTKECGDFNIALDQIKNYALAGLIGDCNLLERMYMQD